MKAIRMFMLMMAAMLVVGSVQVTVAGTKKTEQEKREEEKLREKRREERRKRREAFHKVGDKVGKHNKTSHANEKERAIGQGLAAAALAAQPEKPKAAAPIAPATVGQAISRTGTLSQEMLKIDPAEGAAKVKIVIMTTKEGQRVVFSPESIDTYSLTGLDLRTMVGKEVTINAMASPRKVENKAGYYVHKIKLMTRKDSGMFDDLE